MTSYYCQNSRIIDTKVRMLLERYCRKELLSCKPIPVESVAESLGLNIEYQYLTKYGKAVLGKVICSNGYTPYYDMEEKGYRLLAVKEGTVLIEARLIEQDNNIGRYRFTLAHEIGHWIMHREKINSYRAEAAFEDNFHSANIERQADYFASSLLMPASAVKKQYYSTIVKVNNGDKFALIEKMAEHFEVSKQAMEISLRSYNLI